MTKRRQYIPYFNPIFYRCKYTGCGYVEDIVIKRLNPPYSFPAESFLQKVQLKYGDYYHVAVISEGNCSNWDRKRVIIKLSDRRVVVWYDSNDDVKKDWEL
jgi:hypothetical protein